MELWLWILSGLLWAGSATSIGLGIHKYRQSRRLLWRQTVSEIITAVRKATVNNVKKGVASGKLKSVPPEEVERLVDKVLMKQDKGIKEKFGISGDINAWVGTEANKEIVMAAMYFGISAFLIGLSGVFLVVFKGG